MAVTFRNDAPARRDKKKQQTVKIVGQSKSKLRPPFAAILRTTAYITWANNSTARSETARFRKNFFILAGINEAFHRARITRIFPTVATREKVKCNAHNESPVKLNKLSNSLQIAVAELFGHGEISNLDPAMCFIMKCAAICL